MKQLRQFVCDAKGVAAVEFALVAPVFLVLLLGILYYGIYFGAVSSVQELTADAARASVAGINQTERQTIVTNYVKDSSADYLLLRHSAIDVVAAAFPGDPTRYTVTLTTDASALPLQSGLNLFPLPSKTITRTAVVRIGGY
jgi:Flp pilus assembly protein TadG